MRNGNGLGELVEICEICNDNSGFSWSCGSIVIFCLSDTIDLLSFFF
jgi:hypothetical protein